LGDEAEERKRNHGRIFMRRIVWLTRCTSKRE
jgi:hypothetical protein